MSEPRVIKKYPNRRLYDTVQSKYITLSDIRSLVLERIDFVVIDKKSQEDITRSILLQVIAEQEHGVDPVMSRDFLSQVIRSYGGTLQGVLSSYLEQSMKLFNSQQRELRDKVKSVVGMDPVETVAGVAQRNYQRWRSVQDEIFKTLMNAAGRGGRDGEDKSATGESPPSHQEASQGSLTPRLTARAPDAQPEFPMAQCPQCENSALVHTMLAEGLAGYGCGKCLGTLVSLVAYRAWREGPARSSVKLLPPAIADTDPPDSIGAKKCPKCRSLMSKYRVMAGKTNRLDYCPHCEEVWLDDGEWQLVEGLVASGDFTKVFTQTWQHAVRNQVASGMEERRLRELLGADYDRVEQFAEWLQSQSSKPEILARLARRK